MAKCFHCGELNCESDDNSVPLVRGVARCRARVTGRINAWRGWAERIGTNFLDASLTDEQLRERVTALLVSQHEQLTDAALGAPVHD